jgi:excinuclease ABC subunit A
MANTCSKIPDPSSDPARGPVVTDQLIIRGAREHNLKERVAGPARATSSSSSPGCPARASRRWRSTPSSPRASVATSSRSRPTPVSSWADGQARRRLHRGPLARHLDRPEVDRAATRARRWARSPRSTTTCACCTRASGVPHCPSLRRESSASRRPSRSSTGDAGAAEGTRFQVLAPVVRGRKGELRRRCSKSSGPGLRARVPVVDGETVRDLDEPRTNWLGTRRASTPSRSSSTGW